MDRDKRLERFDAMVDEGRIIRRRWTGTDGQGRELACLLAALSPEVGEAQDASECPGDIMPEWLAFITPSIDDGVSGGYWPEMVERYRKCAHRWHALDDAAWRRAECRVLAACLQEAMPYAGNEGVFGYCQSVLALCLREADGDPPVRAAWVAARDAGAVIWTSTGTSAAYIAWSAARCKGVAARDAACAATRAAFGEVSWDRIAVAVFEAIECECEGNTAE